MYPTSQITADPRPVTLAASELEVVVVEHPFSPNLQPARDGKFWYAEVTMPNSHLRNGYAYRGDVQTDPEVQCYVGAHYLPYSHALKAHIENRLKEAGYKKLEKDEATPCQQQQAYYPDEKRIVRFDNVKQDGSPVNKAEIIAEITEAVDEFKKAAFPTPDEALAKLAQVEDRLTPIQRALARETGGAGVAARLA